MLIDYDWPGNVRELENCMERAVALCRLDEITVDDLPAKVQEHAALADRDHDGIAGRADHARRDGAPLRPPGADAVGGNKTHAARILGIDRRTISHRVVESTQDVHDE